MNTPNCAHPNESSFFRVLPRVDLTEMFALLHLPIAMFRERQKYTRVCSFPIHHFAFKLNDTQILSESWILQISDICQSSNTKSICFRHTPFIYTHSQHDRWILIQIGKISQKNIKYARQHNKICHRFIHQITTQTNSDLQFNTNHIFYYQFHNYLNMEYSSIASIQTYLW